jgi:class 3 adenylate cyclase
MTERLGDHAALRVVADHNKIVRTQCEAHGGFEVELRGDGFLVAFPTPAAGVRCAVAHGLNHVVEGVRSLAAARSWSRRGACGASSEARRPRRPS